MGMTDRELSNLVWDRAIKAMKPACDAMAASIAPPQITQLPNGPVYRYAHKGYKEALVLKSVRYLSGMHSLRLLLDNGLILDAGAVMRSLDEINLDVMFIAGPYIFNKEPKKWHRMYLSEFFQEEFDHADPLQSTQKRHRVSREKIRSYVAGTYGNDGQIAEMKNVFSTIETAFSGYVHGAAGHIIDVFDGRRFCTQLNKGDGPLETVLDQRNNYCMRGLMTFSTAAKGIGLDDLSRNLYALDRELFDEYGKEHPLEP